MATSRPNAYPFAVHLGAAPPAVNLALVDPAVARWHRFGRGEEHGFERRGHGVDQCCSAVEDPPWQPGAVHPGTRADRMDRLRMEHGWWLPARHSAPALPSHVLTRARN